MRLNGGAALAFRNPPTLPRRHARRGNRLRCGMWRRSIVSWSRPKTVSVGTCIAWRCSQGCVAQSCWDFDGPMTNVDIGTGRVMVVETLQRIYGRGLVAGQPKTLKSRRSIALGKEAVKPLRSCRSGRLNSAWLLALCGRIMGTSSRKQTADR